MKHDNVVTYESFCLNVLRSALCDDALFVASCINGSIARVISWPDEIERCCMGALNPHISGCVGIIDDVLVDIFHPWNNPLHSKWFNGRKNICIA